MVVVESRPEVPSSQARSVQLVWTDWKLTENQECYGCTEGLGKVQVRSLKQEYVFFEVTRTEWRCKKCGHVWTGGKRKDK